MDKVEHISYERLIELVNYDCKTGVFTKKKQLADRFLDVFLDTERTMATLHLLLIQKSTLHIALLGYMFIRNFQNTT